MPYPTTDRNVSEFNDEIMKQTENIIKGLLAENSNINKSKR